MSLKGITNQRFSYRGDIIRGTEVIIDKVLKDKNTASGIAFRVSKCHAYPKLEGQTICSSLVGDVQKIIEHFENDSVEEEKRVLLLII